MFLKKYLFTLSLFGVSFLLNFYGRSLYKGALYLIPREHFVAVILIVALACGTSSFMAFQTVRVAILKHLETVANKFVTDTVPILQYCAYALASLGILIFAVQLQEEYFHLITYSLLGLFLSYESSLQRNSWLVGAVGACSITNELIQGMLPYRVFDLRDIFIDTLAGSLGVCIYRIFSKRKTPLIS